MNSPSRTLWICNRFSHEQLMRALLLTERVRFPFAIESPTPVVQACIDRGRKDRLLIAAMMDDLEKESARYSRLGLLAQDPARLGWRGRRRRGWDGKIMVVESEYAQTYVDCFRKRTWGRVIPMGRVQ